MNSAGPGGRVVRGDPFVRPTTVVSVAPDLTVVVPHTIAPAPSATTAATMPGAGDHFARPLPPSGRTAHAPGRRAGRRDRASCRPGRTDGPPRSTPRPEVGANPRRHARRPVTVRVPPPRRSPARPAYAARRTRPPARRRSSTVTTTGSAPPASASASADERDHHERSVDGRRRRHDRHDRGAPRPRPRRRNRRRPPRRRRRPNRRRPRRRRPSRRRRPPRPRRRPRRRSRPRRPESGAPSGPDSVPIRPPRPHPNPQVIAPSPTTPPRRPAESGPAPAVPIGTSSSTRRAHRLARGRGGHQTPRSCAAPSAGTAGGGGCRQGRGQAGRGEGLPATELLAT